MNQGTIDKMSGICYRQGRIFNKIADSYGCIKYYCDQIDSRLRPEGDKCEADSDCREGENCKDNICISEFALITGTPVATSAPLKYDNFAQCLSNSGVKMYGTFWCTYCEKQKAMFGDSWKYIKYIECSLPDRSGQTEECNKAGITAYPTWEFSDGRFEGFETFEQLSQHSNCKLG